ncbi:hypothetical protein FPV67DRAFT_1003509 [Lyophyllum atratum]|nr:hypothetical protein FPV67DRAFT_1003509 [Lyophyllum atratum]
MRPNPSRSFIFLSLMSPSSSSKQSRVISKESKGHEARGTNHGRFDGPYPYPNLEPRIRSSNRRILALCARRTRVQEDMVLRDPKRESDRVLTANLRPSHRGTRVGRLCSSPVLHRARVRVDRYYGWESLTILGKMKIELTSMVGWKWSRWRKRNEVVIGGICVRAPAPGEIEDNVDALMIVDVG